MSQIFISHTSSDLDKALQLKSVLENKGMEVITSESAVGNHSTGESLANADTLIVLVGKETRSSKWVDKEIEMGLSSGDKGAPSGLLAMVLEDHQDFERPFYDPKNVPVRVHDALQWESGLLRKWSLDEKDLGNWIEEAGLRRKRVPNPQVSFSAQSELESFGWDEAIDAERQQS